MSAQLHAHSEDEIDDLVVWSENHPDDISDDLRFQLSTFLDSILINDEFPVVVDVPNQLVEPLSELMIDWIEVLAAHDEGLETHLVIE